MEHANDTSIINDLIETTIDSADGYRRAADDAHSDSLRQIFLDRSREREAVVAELQAHVRSLGGEPATTGSTLAGAHRWFMDMKDALMGGDDKSVIDEVERGEDHIKAKFEDARADAGLSQTARAVIDRSYASVRAGHDQMSSLKHGYGDSNV